MFQLPHTQRLRHETQIVVGDERDLDGPVGKRSGHTLHDASELLRLRTDHLPGVTPQAALCVAGSVVEGVAENPGPRGIIHEDLHGCLGIIQV